MAAAQRLALELAYPSNCRTIEVTFNYKEPRYKWDTDAEKWRKRDTTKTLRHTLNVCGPTCPTKLVSQVVKEEYFETVEKTRDVEYTVDVVKTRKIPYTEQEPRTRRVPYTVQVPRTREVPYQDTVTFYRDEKYTVQVPRTRREPYQVPVTRYRTRTVTETVYRDEGYRTWVSVPVQVSRTRYRTETRYRWVSGIAGPYRQSYTVRVPYTVMVTEYRRVAADRVRKVPVQVQRQVTESYIAMETRYREVSYTAPEERTRRIPYTTTVTRYRTEEYKETETRYREEEYTVSVTKYRVEPYVEKETRVREETYTVAEPRTRPVAQQVEQEQCPQHILDARALYRHQRSQAE